MKSNGRGIWSSIITANAERGPFGLPSVWAKDLGFDASRTSTEYFRQLMSEDPLAKTNGGRRPICEDMRPRIFGGAGVPCADTLGAFTGKNNAWQALCVSTQTPPNVAFLVTRNLEMGRQVNALSPLRFDKRAPLWIRRYVCLTCGGGCFDLRAKYLCTSSGVSYAFEDLGTNTAIDVMKP